MASDSQIEYQPDSPDSRVSKRNGVGLTSGIDARIAALSDQVDATLNRLTESGSAFDADLDTLKRHEMDLAHMLSQLAQRWQGVELQGEMLGQAREEASEAIAQLNQQKEELAALEQSLQSAEQPEGSAVPESVEPSPPAVAEDAATPEEPSDERAEEPALETSPSGLLAIKPKKRNSEPVIESPDGDADTDSLDTIDFTEDELEKLRVLRRMGATGSDAELIRRIRADRSSSRTVDGDAGAKSKRRWW